MKEKCCILNLQHFSLLLPRKLHSCIESGIILKVGKTLENQWRVGQKVVVQPALKLESGYDPGYSYQYIGGNTQYAIVSEIVLERGCLLPYNGEGYFKGSVVESLACIIRGYKGFYHTDYTNCSVDEIKKRGVELHYINTSEIENVEQYLIDLSEGGFDDVFVMVPVPALYTMAEKICCEDGYINFFAMEKSNGAKKICYNELDLSLIAIDELEELGKTNPLYANLWEIVNKNGGIWCAEAKKYLLENAPKL